MKFRKYYFTATQKASAFAKIQKEVTNAEGEASMVWDLDKVALVVDLGQPIKTPAVIDEEGNVITEAVLDSKHEVDIVWQDEPLTTSFASYMVWPTPCGRHSLGHSLDQEYAEAYCQANPDAAYCQPPAPIEP